MNNTNGHTPGPWFTQDEFDGEFSVYARDPSTHRLATCYDEDMDHAIPAKANAAIIAAAPELLAVLEAVVANSDAQEAKGHLRLRGSYMFELYEQATAAIRKARGEPA